MKEDFYLLGPMIFFFIQEYLSVRYKVDATVFLIEKSGRRPYFCSILGFTETCRCKQYLVEFHVMTTMYLSSKLHFKLFTR